MWGYEFQYPLFSVWSTMTLQEAYFRCVSRYLLLSILCDHFPALPHQLFLLHPLWSILITCFEINHFSCFFDCFVWSFFWLDFGHASYHNIENHFWTTIMDFYHKIMSWSHSGDCLLENNHFITKCGCFLISCHQNMVHNFSRNLIAMYILGTMLVFQALSQYILVLGMMSNNHQQKSESSPPWRHETACARSWK